MTPPEYQRQLRGVFAVLRTLVRQTREGRQTVDDYADHLEGRIGALARVQEILMRAPPEGVDLNELVCEELMAQVIRDDQVRVSGPEVRIAPGAATPMTLALHELTVNALTHGAFSTPAGHVAITWSIQPPPGAEDSPELVLEWQESGLELSGDTPQRKGFGSEVLERLLPYELGARTTFTTTRHGIQACLFIPARAGGLLWRPTNIEVGEHEWQR
jgi:two-component system CheB/CheR fusion protein